MKEAVADKYLIEKKVLKFFFFHLVYLTPCYYGCNLAFESNIYTALLVPKYRNIRMCVRFRLEFFFLECFFACLPRQAFFCAFLTGKLKSGV